MSAEKDALRFIYGAIVCGAFGLFIWSMALFPIWAAIVGWAFIAVLALVVIYTVGCAFVEEDKGDINDHYG